MKKLIILTIFIFGASYDSKAQKDHVADQRLAIALKFAMAFKQNRLSNDEIMKKFVVEADYFRNDSIRRCANQWMDGLRKGFKEIDESEFVPLAYALHEDEFLVFYNTRYHRMIIDLGKPDGSNVPVDLKDLYVVVGKSKKKDAKIFILFNTDDKIVSFAGLRSGLYFGMFVF
jgi:hypothetical protein